MKESGDTRLSGVIGGVAVQGVHGVRVPVIFAGLPTVAAGAPLRNGEGMTGKIMRVSPLIVIPTLLFSLVESLLVLPVHLRHGRRRRSAHSWWLPRGWRAFQERFAGGLEWFIRRIYSPALRLSLEWRYTVAAAGVTTLLLTAGLVGGGFIKFTFFPEVEADFITAEVTMPQGTPPQQTLAAVRSIADAARELGEELAAERPAEEGQTLRHMLTSVGEQPVRSTRGENGGRISNRVSGSHLGEVAVELSPAETRSISSTEIARRWREKVGAIPDALEQSFSSSLFSPGAPIEIQLAGRDVGELTRAAAALPVMVASLYSRNGTSPRPIRTWVKNSRPGLRNGFSAATAMQTTAATGSSAMASAMSKTRLTNSTRHGGARCTALRPTGTGDTRPNLSGVSWMEIYDMTGSTSKTRPELHPWREHSARCDPRWLQVLQVPPVLENFSQNLPEM